MPIKRMERWSHKRLLELAKVTQAWKTKSQDLNFWKIPHCCLTSLPPCYYSTGPTGLCACVQPHVSLHTRSPHHGLPETQQDLCHHHLRVLITLFPPQFSSLASYYQDQWGGVNLMALPPSSWREQELLRRKAHPCWDSWEVRGSSGSIN